MSAPPRLPRLLRSRLLAVAAVFAVVAGCGGGKGASGADRTARPTRGPAAVEPGSGGTTGATAPGVAPLETASGMPSGGPAPGLPSFAHVYLLVLENKDFASLVGSKDAPYLNSLLSRFALATNYFAVAHPSQPNYIALFSGSTQGVTTDGNYDLSARNLADQLEASGRTWTVYEQGYPGGCFTGEQGPAVPDGPGDPGPYVRKHNPAISFTDVSGDPARCARIKPLASFDPGAADFELIAPNLCNDTHSCSVATGDAFLAAFVPMVIGSPEFARSVLFITTDEGTSNVGGGGRVATIVASPLVKPGFKSATAHDHYSLLRTIEDAWGIGCLAQSCSANTLSEFFR